MVSTSRATLEIVARAKDEFSGELRQQLRKLRTDISSNVTRPSLTATKAVQGIAAAFTALVGVRALRAVGREALELGTNLSQVASEATELRNRINVTFGDGAARLEDFSRELRDSTGRGILDTQETAGAFQVLLTGFGLAREEAQRLGEEATRLSTDFSSFFDIDPNTARQSLIAGLVGEIEVLRRRFNVAVNDQLLRAEALRLGYRNLGSALNPAVRAVATLSLAARQQRAALGDAERTSQEYANTVRNISSQLRDLRAQLGEELNRELLELINNLGGPEGVVAAIEVGLRGATEALKGFIQVLATDGTRATVGFLETLRGLSSLPFIGNDALQSSLDNFLEQPVLRAAQLRLELEKLTPQVAALARGDFRDIGVDEGQTRLLRETTEFLLRRTSEVVAELSQLESQLPDIGAVFSVASEEAARLNNELTGLALDAVLGNTETRVTSLSGVLARVAGEVASVAEESSRLVAGQTSFIGVDNEGDRRFEQFARELDRLSESVPSIRGLDPSQFIPQFEQFQAATRESRDALGELDEVAKATVESLNQTAEAKLRDVQASTGYQSIAEITAAAQERFTLSTEEQVQALRAQRDAQVEAISRFRELTGETDAAEAAIAAVTRAYEDQAAKLQGDVVPALEEVGQKQREASEVGERFSNALNSGLTAGFSALTPDIDRATGALEQFISALLRAIQLAASQELADLLSGLFRAGAGATLGSANSNGSVPIGSDVPDIGPVVRGGPFGGGGPSSGGGFGGPPVPIPVSSGAGAGLGGGGVQVSAQEGQPPVQVVFQVSAIDQASVQNFFAQNRQQIGEQVVEAFYESSVVRQTLGNRREF